MSGGIIALMIGISTLLGGLGLLALLWGIKTKQFEDYRKFLDGTKYDDEESLNDAYKMEQKQKEAAKKGYRPPD
ncbi:cbb3-type cytochrome oxidase assembly protein CcoS [Campylobacter sp.]|uniref:cbb3-type cytochrome oxidase assembly protein CcoS n=1 Tax=Campylobacter sp. TaxID=205 RepID=UPI00270D174C|nr:cbb3-type cytochrome oxidase assembly protein CcoS [Campylobacter sp.]